MKIYPHTITFARQTRSILRFQLAELLKIPTSKLREIEKLRRNTFESSPEFGKPFMIEIEDSLISKIAEITEFPLPFFQNEKLAEPSKSKPFICSSYDNQKCDCGNEATLLCDAVTVRLEPVYADRFNPLVKELKEVKETCDCPLCPECAIRQDELDFCQYHEKNELPKCSMCFKRHLAKDLCWTIKMYNDKHLQVKEKQLTK